MAVIRVLEAISAGFGVVWQRGETQDVSDDLARLLVTQRRAEYVSPPAAPADWLVPVMKKVDEAAAPSSSSGFVAVPVSAAQIVSDAAPASPGTYPSSLTVYCISDDDAANGISKGLLCCYIPPGDVSMPAAKGWRVFLSLADTVI